MVVMTNGNTAGGCIGTGQPFVSRRGSRYGIPFGPGPLGTLGRSPLGFNQRNSLSPFPSLSPSYGLFEQPQEVAVVTTPLKATAHTATIDGKIKNTRLIDIYGRAIGVCRTAHCKDKTDTCGTIARDSLSIEEFDEIRRKQALLHNVHDKFSSNTNSLNHVNKPNEPYPHPHPQPHPPKDLFSPVF